ncbi:hypothetical protein V2J09_009260 [Rumex salicifolius]
MNEHPLKRNSYAHNRDNEEAEMLVKLTCVAPSLFLVLLLSVAVTGLCAKQYTRDDFPPGFIFGSGTSAYQVEGAVNEDGRTPSIFDTLAHDESWHAGNGDVACDGYHKYKEDVQLMVETGLEAYRFSISWPRLIPNGRGPVNPKGLAYYNNLINELLKHGIEPHVTLVHMDVPQALQDEYGTFLSRRIIKDFTAYADVCFREFGDRVLHWTTINEGNVFVLGGYDNGQTPPRRCSPPFGSDCRGGNSTTEPYIAAHNMLLAHASAVRLYRKRYQAKQRGYVGLSLYAFNHAPATNETQDLLAAKRANDFYLGWFMEPLLHGDYPEIMKKNVGDRLPTFTKQESKILKGAYDFVGLNHYASVLAKDNPQSLTNELRDFTEDMAASLLFDFSSAPPGSFYPIAPWGMEMLLEYFKEAYGNPPIYIHENGQMTVRNTMLNDTSRVEYLQSYIGGLLDAIRSGSNARGYFTWSFLDVFELFSGYESAFGLYYVDLDDPNLTRYPKSSQHWYSGFLKGKNISKDEIVQTQENYAISVASSSK